MGSASPYALLGRQLQFAVRREEGLVGAAAIGCFKFDTKGDVFTMEKASKFMVGLAAFAMLTFFAATHAQAQAIVDNGFGIALGVDAAGQLNVPNGTGPSSAAAVNSGFTGLSFFTNYGSGTPDWRDATSPGCICEGWGVSANDGADHAGFANNAVDGVVNLTVDSFTNTATSVISSVHLSSFAGLMVTQDYHPSLSTSLYEDTVTITNGTGAALSNVRYKRVMDWDVPPTEFSEFVTIGGWPATNLEHTSDDGFATANPLFASSSICFGAPDNSNFTDSGPCDHGAEFIFNFGTLAAGDKQTFKIYYGAATTEAGALAALGAVGAEVFSLGQSNTTDGPSLGTPATFAFGFKGVGGTPLPTVPEPSTLLLLGSGLVGLVLKGFRKS